MQQSDGDVSLLDEYGGFLNSVKFISLDLKKKWDVEKKIQDVLDSIS